MSKRPKVEIPTAIALLGPARATREKVEEFVPLVLYRPRRGEGMMAVLEGEGTLADQLAALLPAMRAQLGPADWIAVTTDAYHKVTPNPEDIPDTPLRDAFEAGDPTVTEQMIVILRSRYKPTEIATQQYRYLPSEGWEWDEPVVIDEHQSDVMDVLNYYM